MASVKPPVKAATSNGLPVHLVHFAAGVLDALSRPRTLTFAAFATSEGVSSLRGDGSPLDGLKNAGKSSVPYDITGTPFVSRTLLSGSREDVCCHRYAAGPERAQVTTLGQNAKGWH